ncbi:transketolase [soil metagenome]
MSATTTDRQTLDELCVNTIRTLSMDAVQKANSGHPGTPMALAPLAYVLYTRVLRHNPRNAEWPNRDRFVLSAGHASMLLYSVLYLTGYGLELDDLKRFRQLGSPAAGHPEREDAEGIETTTGPLGQGISTAVGMALGERMLAARFNRDGHDVVDHRTFVIASDGDLQEGVSSESSSFAGHMRLGHLVVFYDDNHISIEGDTGLSFSEDVGARYEAYGWHVQDLGENLALDALERASQAAIDAHDRPSLVIVRSHIAQGSPNKQDTAGAHGSPLGEEEVELTKKAYGWPTGEPFHVPSEALEHMRGCVERGEGLEREWRDGAGPYRDAHPDLWSELERIAARRLPEGWDSEVPRFEPSVGALATRKASNQVLQWAASRVPELAGGSADLAPSTLTLVEDGGDVEAGAYSGRNLHFGIREHAMGAIVNGLSLQGFRAYGATFLIFSDYMRASIRLAALMAMPSIFCFTHDSIGLGEDGTTHQPVEQLVGLRAIPNLYVVRPGDANETALAWQFAISRERSPTAMALSRQGLPVLDSEVVPDDAIERGAYVLRGERGEELDAILIGTGSEVQVCADALEALEEQGLSVRLVSMPCMERFAEQDQAYRDSVLPPSCRARVCVEAASPVGWERWATEDGEVVGMTTFGASAPQKDLYEHFGITGERVAETARQAVDRMAAGGREA